MTDDYTHDVVDRLRGGSGKTEPQPEPTPDYYSVLRRNAALIENFVNWAFTVGTWSILGGVLESQRAARHNGNVHGDPFNEVKTQALSLVGAGATVQDRRIINFDMGRVLDNAPAFCTLAALATYCTEYIDAEALPGQDVIDAMQALFRQRFGVPS